MKLSEYLIVDGYNVINAWDELKGERIHFLESSMQKLPDIMADYQGFKAINAVVVFDAHYVKNSMEKHEAYNDVGVVFTREFKSADSYTERLMAKDSHVSVVTCNWVERLTVPGLGAVRVPAGVFKKEIEDMRKVMERAI